MLLWPIMKGQDVLKLDVANYVFGTVSYSIKGLMTRLQFVNEFKSTAY